MPDKMDPIPSPYGDFVLPFDIAKAGVRGRLVRLDAASARALTAHALPEAAARVAGEAVAMARWIWSPPIIMARTKFARAACAAMPAWMPTVSPGWTIRPSPVWRAAA